MALFGPKAVCPRCGKQVRKHRNASDFLCPHCGKPGQWASPEQSAGWQAQEAERLRREAALGAARTAYGSLLERIATGVADPNALGALAPTAALTAYTSPELNNMNMETVRRYLEVALSDDIVTRDEDGYLKTTVSNLGLTLEGVNESYPHLVDHLLIARANGGLLPKVSPSQLIPKKGEVVHLEWPASLMKEVTLREFRAGYQGFSFPIGKTGIRYRVGGARGHSVVVGTQLQIADSGILSISSLRAVFIGARKTVEMPYSKLVNLTVYTDGVQFHQSNRQTAPLFKVRNGEIVAAFVNAAVRG